MHCLCMISAVRVERVSWGVGQSDAAGGVYRGGHHMILCWTLGDE